MIGRTLRGFNHLISFLCGEGTWSLRPTEKLIVDATIESLANEVQALVRAQLGQACFVQRIPAQIGRIFFYQPDEGLRIPDPEFMDRLMKVRIEVEGREQNVHVTFRRGYIFSIEFKRPPRFYADKKISVRGVSTGTTSQSHTRAIDRLEHGTSKEDEY